MTSASPWSATVAARCRSCGAAVIWASTTKGKLTPVDALPVEAGNILLSHRHAGVPPVAIIQGPLDIEMLRVQRSRSHEAGPLRLFVSHFSTCPNAAAHRAAKGHETDRGPE